MESHIKAPKLPDGAYLLGFPPKEGIPAKLLWRFQIKDGKLIHDHPMSMTLEFILRSGEASMNNDSKYLIMNE